MAILVAKGHSQDPQTMGVRLFGRCVYYAEYGIRDSREVVCIHSYGGTESNPITPCCLMNNLQRRSLT